MHYLITLLNKQYNITINCEQCVRFYIKYIFVGCFTN